MEDSLRRADGRKCLDSLPPATDRSFLVLFFKKELLFWRLTFLGGESFLMRVDINI